jgi:hypothetical protein
MKECDEYFSFLQPTFSGENRENIVSIVMCMVMPRRERVSNLEEGQAMSDVMCTPLDNDSMRV